MLAASVPLAAPDGSLWWATVGPGNRWVVWNLYEFSMEPTFASLDAARQSLGVRTPGS